MFALCGLLKPERLRNPDGLDLLGPRPGRVAKRFIRLPESVGVGVGVCVCSINILFLFLFGNYLFYLSQCVCVRVYLCMCAYADWQRETKNLINLNNYFVKFTSVNKRYHVGRQPWPPIVK